jgi:glycosyltransferase involved in cell wall biosynthesis
MRFLMLSWRDPANPRAGGAERVTQAYWRALRERGHETYWYSNEFPGCQRQEEIEGVRIVRGGWQGSSVLEAVLWYRQQPGFDLVVDQHHGIPWLAPWWSRTNCISYLHEVLGPIWNSFYRRPLATVGQAQERFVHWLYRRVPFWVGSESTKRALHRRGVRKVTVVHYGIDLVPLREIEPKPLVQPLELIVVSRLAPNKRIDHAIRATRVLLQRGIACRLSVVGGGEVEVPLRELTGELGVAEQVTFRGRLSEREKDDLLRHSHLLVHTSLREGWGLNVLEANAMGTPAVVYPVDGLVDATLHDQTGLVAANETPEAVADAIGSLLVRPEKYQDYRVNALERTKSFHWSKVLPGACDWLERQARGDFDSLPAG